jgi:hypothetical protein
LLICFMLASIKPLRLLQALCGKHSSRFYNAGVQQLLERGEPV